MSYRSADRLRRRSVDAELRFQLTRDFAVRRRLSVGDAQEKFPNGESKNGALRAQRRGEVRLLAFEVDVEPADRFGENRRFAFRVVFRQRMCIKLFAFKP